ncbi:cytochrome P450 [Nannocystis pusilla]|uniref:cytochrome P450 n=1 Tax=Nannocystis pusilla TaxID=889268 RepID=UPI003B78711B
MSFTSTRNDSKSAAVVTRRIKIEPGAEHIRAFERAREVLLDRDLLQGGAGAEFVDTSDPDKAPVFFLDGAPHREKRTSIARFFTPKAITSRYHAIIERETARLLGQLRRDGRAQLDIISFELTVAVAANIVGLTDSDMPKMARRLALMLSAGWHHRLDVFARLAAGLRKGRAMLGFYVNDITLPSARAARPAGRPPVRAPGQGRVAAGDPHRVHDLRRRRHGDDARVHRHGRLAPVRRPCAAGRLPGGRRGAPVRHPERDPPPRADRLAALPAQDRRVGQGQREVCARPAGDPRGRGRRRPVPRALDPDRAQRMKTNGAYLSFGAGAHHCPGKQVALHETRMFLDALLRVRGSASSARPTSAGRRCCSATSCATRS